VKHLVLFHHDPERKDAELDALLAQYQRAVKSRTRLRISVAQEGKTIEV
jgi:hypothetical protein